jgi:Holliday junction resolvasome RuvABC endonuclease subunit
MGIDLSLSRTGVAFVGDPLDGGVETYSFGRSGKRDEPLRTRLERLEELVDQIHGSICENMEWPWVACIEDVAFGTPGGSTTDRAGLWWMTVRMLTRQGIPVVPVNVSKVKIYATGRGNKHEKDEVMLAIVRRYPDAPIQNNDEADATVLAMIGARLVGRPYETHLPQTHLRAMEGLVMP